MIRNAIVDSTETTLRDLRRSEIGQLLVGQPLLGATIGILANALGLLITRLPTPYEFLAAIALVATSLWLFQSLTNRLEEPVGDVVNRALTRIVGLPWIPFRFRPKLLQTSEPWQTTLVVSILLWTVAHSSSTTIDFPRLIDQAWLPSALTGGTIAVIRALMSKKTWDRLMRRAVVTL